MLRSSAAARPLPHFDRIQAAFGDYALDSVQAQVGGQARTAADDLQADAFATAEHVAFRQLPDLRTAAHEAAHIIQQRQRPPLDGRIGTDQDHFERHADAVAEAVVQGRSAEPLLDSFAASAPGAAPRLQRQSAAPSTDQEDALAETHKALREALADSNKVIQRYRDFLDGEIEWDDVMKKIEPLGNAAQGVVGAGKKKHPIVQSAIAEVEEFGFEEILHFGRLVIGTPSLLGEGEFFKRQWVRNEIERQQHYNRVLVRKMYETGSPDVPGTYADYQQQVERVGTKGREMIEPPGTTSTGRTRKTKTALAWAEVGGFEYLILATEVAGAGSLRFETWIESHFRELALERASRKQGRVPSVPGSAVTGLPATPPPNATRRPGSKP